jgi:uncharacterized membrane protein
MPADSRASFFRFLPEADQPRCDEFLESSREPPIAKPPQTPRLLPKIPGPIDHDDSPPSVEKRARTPQIAQSRRPHPDPARAAMSRKPPQTATAPMPLNYQPFADAPELQAVEKDLQMNLTERERNVSVLTGAGLAISAFRWHGATRWLLLLGGAILLRRGVSGHCSWYASLGLDRRHPSRGVAGNRGLKLEHSVEVNRSPEVLYAFWRNLEQLPRVMRHVESVHQSSDRRSRWKVKAPAGQSVEWEAEIINDDENALIAWQSLAGATVANAGSIRFEPLTSEATRIKVTLQYDPPGGVIGGKLASLLGSSPQAELAEDLEQFKEYAERELSPQ